MIKKLLFIIIVALGFSSEAQNRKTKNVIIITLDGFRWQEVFTGADKKILSNRDFITDTSVIDLYNDASPLQRREKLMPFFWNVIAKEGQLYGNRSYNNHVNCANLYWFSYPGYSELLVGFVSKKIKTNEPIENPNTTVLDFIHQQPGFENKVAAFGTWNVINNIAREQSSHIPVNAGHDKAHGNISFTETLLNEFQDIIPNPHGERFDGFTFYYAFEYLKREHPRAMFISLDETDEHGHGGRYDEYLKSAHATDQMISNLWHWIQSDEQYRDQTTLIITTDHGRGDNARKGWKKHGLLFSGSGQIWFAVLGPDTPPLGEMKNTGLYFQKQIAKTAASFLGLEYSNVFNVGKEIKSMLYPSTTSDQYVMGKGQSLQVGE